MRSKAECKSLYFLISVLLPRKKTVTHMQKPRKKATELVLYLSAEGIALRFLHDNISERY